MHRAAVPEAVTVEGPDRLASGRSAAARGARVLVLDDGFQRLPLARDLDIVLVSAESAGLPRWTLPAGPWREPWRALRRADLVVITRRVAGPETVAALRERLRRAAPTVPIISATLTIAGFRGLCSGRPVAPAALRGRRLLVSAGIADPETLAAQCRALGATVTLRAWPDHHRYRPGDVTRLLQGARAVDYVVVTRKDAGKLSALWPERWPEPLVANLAVDWGGARVVMERALRRVVGDPRRRGRPSGARAVGALTGA